MKSVDDVVVRDGGPFSRNWDFGWGPTMVVIVNRLHKRGRKYEIFVGQMAILSGISAVVKKKLELCQQS